MKIPIPKFLEDLAIISKLGDNPGADNGLSANALKAKFDEAVLKLQDYLNNTVVETINSIFSLDAPAHEGMNMTGPINMNQQTLSGLNAPTKDDEAANKGYVDTNKVDKANVVNNFTTTEEGFVADARVLKTLNDSKLSMELLWENASPESEFESKTISLDLSAFGFVAIVYSYSTVIVKVGTSGQNNFINRWGTNQYNYQHEIRNFETRITGIIFYNSYAIGSGFQPTLHNTSNIPLKIYGIKGVSA